MKIDFRALIRPLFSASRIWIQLEFLFINESL